MLRFPLTRLFKISSGFRNLSKYHYSSSVAAADDAVDPYGSADFFGVHRLFSISDLFKARVHYGHTKRSLDERMRPFVFGSRFDMCIIDLDQTAFLLRQALNFVAHIAAKGGIILFVCRQPHLVHMVERTAIECGEFAHCHAWKPDFFCAPQLTYGGEIRLPDTVILLHTKDGLKYGEHCCIADAAKVGIPSVAIVDTDCNPNIVTYPVPGNDDTIESIQLYLHIFKQAIMLGKAYRKNTTTT